MPKRDDMHNLYIRGGTYWARKKVEGVEHRQSLRTAVPSVARKRRDKFLEKLGTVYNENRKTWKMAAMEWDERMVGEVSKGTQTRYDYSIRNVTPKIGELYLDEINKAALGDLVSWRREHGVSNATIRRDLTAIASVLDVAESMDWIDGNPARDYAKRLKERRDPIVLPRPEDIDFVVAGAPGNFANLIRFAQYTGMRQDEVVSLERTQIRDNTIDLTKTKTNTPRSFDMDDRAEGTLKGTAKYPKSPFVFWHGEGARYHNVASQFRRVMRQCIAAKAKAEESFKPFRFHDLRHWYAVDYLRRGGSI